ncbi:hypothetical protein GCM10027059_11010 [Myceligenerans halotolerans]
MEFIVDNSLWQRLPHDGVIATRIENLEQRFLISACPPQVLEYCRSARNRAEYERNRRRMDRLYTAPLHPTVSDVLDVQEAMRRRGIDVRQGTITDTLIAAYAMVNDMTVLAADHDFEYISDALGGALRQEYIAPSV